MFLLCLCLFVGFDLFCLSCFFCFFGARLNGLKAQAEQQAAREKAVSDFQQSQKSQLEADIKREKIAEQQQLENTLADFAAENDTESMLAMLDGYDKKEADRLFNNAFKTVEKRAKEAEKAVKAKEAEATKQAQAKQKQSAFNADMSALYESNPNATYSDWKAIGKKHGITSAIDLANAWASARANKTKQKDEERNKKRGKNKKKAQEEPQRMEGRTKEKDKRRKIKITQKRKKKR